MIAYKNYICDDDINYQYNGNNKYGNRYDGACSHHARYHYYNLEFMDMFQRKHDFDKIRQENLIRKTIGDII